MRCTPTLVMMLDSGVYGVVPPIEPAELRDMVRSPESVVGLMLETLRREGEARCVLVEEAGSLTPDGLAEHGSALAVAWTLAFSGYATVSEGLYAIPVAEGCVADMDLGECLPVHTGRPTPLAALLYVGPASACDDPRAGRWAFHRLRWLDAVPGPSEGWKVLEDLRGP